MVGGASSAGGFNVDEFINTGWFRFMEIVNRPDGSFCICVVRS